MTDENKNEIRPIAWVAAWLALVFGIAWLGTISLQSPSLSAPQSSGAYVARVAEIAKDQSALKIVRLGAASEPPSALLVGQDEGSRALRTLLKDVAPGDIVKITESGGKLNKLDIQTRSVPPGQRWLTLICSFILLILFAIAVLGSNAVDLIRGLDGRASNSKFQFVVWFGVVMVSYLSTVWLRFCYSGNLLLGLVDIPQSLLTLSGMSVLSFAGAKAITQGKQNALAAAGMNDAMKKTVDRRPQVSDLVQDDAGNPDLGDFQMLLITLIAAFMYLVQIFLFLGALEMRSNVALPDVGGTLLATFGFGQGAYLAKKFASGPKAPDVPARAGAGLPGPPPPPDRLGVEA